MNLFDLSGQVVVITGGLGQLGRQFGQGILEAGGRVALLDLQAGEAVLPEPLQEAARAGRLLAVSGDVTSRDSLSRALSVITDRLGVPTGLINNAALDSPPNAPPEENGPFETFPESSWDQVMAVNVKGVFLACQVFGAAMAAQRQGVIVNVSSIYGMISPDQRIYEYRRQRGETFYKPVAYSASKSALFNLTRYLATYWGTRNVRVNTVTLGGVFNQQEESFLAGYTSRVPLGRMARADEYNGLIVFLLSPAAAYMTGANVVMDGGWTAW